MGWFDEHGLTGGTQSGGFQDEPRVGPDDPPAYEIPGGGYQDQPYEPPTTFTPPQGSTTTTSGGGAYQNTPADRARFLAQFKDKPWFNESLFDQYLANHPDWTANTSYWTQRFTDAPGVGSNAPGVNSGGLRSSMGPPPTLTAAPNLGSAPFREAPDVGSAPFTAAPNVGSAPFTPFEAPAEFAYDKFQAPDPNKVKEDPAYQFRLKAGQDALQASKAAQGTLRTGGTLKDITAWGSDFASQEYDKIYGRAMNEWQSGFDVSKGTYDTNAANDRFAYTANQGGLMDQWKANTDVAMNQWTGTNQGQYNQWLGNTNTAMDQWTGTNQGLYNQWQGNTANEMDIWKATNANTMAKWAAEYGMSQDEIDNLLRMAGIGSTAAAGAPAPVPTSTTGGLSQDPLYKPHVQPNGQSGGLKDLYRDLPSQDSYKTNGWAY